MSLAFTLVIFGILWVVMMFFFIQFMQRRPSKIDDLYRQAFEKMILKHFVN